jgi:hypothetical protein
MNDDELITTVQQSVANVHMTVPAEQITSRGRALRRRRRLPALAGAAATAGATIGLTAGALLPASGPATTALAAWTVTKAHNGTVTITVRQFRDPAGLQRALRADGVPASVWSVGRPNPACHPVRPVPNGLYTSPKHARQHVGNGAQTVFVIHPAALPPRTGVSIASNWQPIPPNWHPRWHWGELKFTVLVTGLVRASAPCTGP